MTNATKKPAKLGESAPKKQRNPNSLANLRPPWKPGESGNPKGWHKAPVVEPLIRHYSRLTYDELRQLQARMDELTLVEIMVLQGYLAAMDQQGDKARDWVTKKLDGDEEKSGSSVNVAVAVQLKWDASE